MKSAVQISAMQALQRQPVKLRCKQIADKLRSTSGKKRSLAMEHISKWLKTRSTLMMTTEPERNQTYYGSKHNSETIQFANGARVADLEILIFK
jgi:hypothetical protein